jgi:hypothetical protein
MLHLIINNNKKKYGVSILSLLEQLSCDFPFKTFSLISILYIKNTVYQKKKFFTLFLEIRASFLIIKKKLSFL